MHVDSIKVINLIIDFVIAFILVYIERSLLDKPMNDYTMIMSILLGGLMIYTFRTLVLVRNIDNRKNRSDK